MDLPDEWVEAAARALVPPHMTWGTRTPVEQAAYRTKARAALSAVAPLIAAQALRDAAEDGEDIGTVWVGDDEEQAVSYWLRTRANRIERSES